MDLILWRHAEAVELPLGQTDYELDLARELTPRGQKQATRMASWLDRQLPEHIKIAVSPASRCQATALALGWTKLTAALVPMLNVFQLRIALLLV